VGHLRSRKNSKKRFFSKFLLQIMKRISIFKSSRPRGDVQLDLSNFLICSVSHNDLPIFAEINFRFFQPIRESHANETAIFGRLTES